MARRKTAEELKETAARAALAQVGTSTPREMIEFASTHFLAFSALVIIVGVFIATILLQGYLSVFDWRLIWIIEYSDVLKVGLVAIAILSGLSVWFSAVVENAFIEEETKPQTDDERLSAWKRRRTNMLVGLGLIALSLIFFLVMQFFSAQPQYALFLSIHGSIAFLLILLATAIERGKNVNAVTVKTWVQDFFVVVLFVYVVGTTIGIIAKERAGFYRDVFTRDGEFREVGLVMITSRYVVVFRDGHSLIMPVGEVTRIEERPRRTAD